MINKYSKYIKLVCVVIVIYLACSSIFSFSKVQDTYLLEEKSLPNTIPLLVMEKMEIKKGPLTVAEWNWRNNETVMGKEIPLYFKESSAVLSYFKWNGSQISLHPDFLDDVILSSSDMNFSLSESIDGSMELIFTCLQDDLYVIKSSEKSMQIELPRLSHAFAGTLKNNEGWILLLVESGKSKYGIDYALKLLRFNLNTQECQLNAVENVPDELTEFLETRVDWRNRKYDRLNCFIVEGDIFLYDERSVYRIDTLENNCKRIFHISNSIPESIVNQYPDIVKSYINDMGYYQGMFILDIIRENGSSRYFYIPFLKEPVIHEQDWEKQWYSESYFPNISG